MLEFVVVVFLLACCVSAAWFWWAAIVGFCVAAFALFVGLVVMLEWPILIIAALLFFPLTRKEMPVTALLLIAFILWFVYAFFGVNVPIWVWHNPIESAALFVAYFAVGAGWSVFKWRLFAVECKQKLDKRLKVFIEAWIGRFGDTAKRSDYWGIYLRCDDGIVAPEERMTAALAELQKGRIPDCLLGKWQEECESCHNEPRLNDLPNSLRYKGKITSWIGFWPFSVIEYLVFDVLMDIWNWLKDLVDAIYRWLTSIYQWIAARVYADVDPRLLRNAGKKEKQNR